MVFDAVVSEQLKDFLSKIEYEVPTDWCWKDFKSACTR